MKTVKSQDVHFPKAISMKMAVNCQFILTIERCWDNLALNREYLSSINNMLNF